MSRRRFPFAPVQRELEHRFQALDCRDNQGHPFTVPAGDAVRAGELLGASRELVGRWRNGLLLTDIDADRCAVRLGLHPIDLWPDFYDTCDEIDAEREAARLAAVARRAEVVRRARLRAVPA